MTMEQISRVIRERYSYEEVRERIFGRDCYIPGGIRRHKIEKVIDPINGATNLVAVIVSATDDDMDVWILTESNGQVGWLAGALGKRFDIESLQAEYVRNKKAVCLKFCSLHFLVETERWVNVKKYVQTKRKNPNKAC